MSREPKPAFSFYAQDFLTGVMFLTNEEVGIYIRMLEKQWTDGKVPKKRLGLLVGYEWIGLSEELRDKFEDRGDYIVNTRLEEERQRKENFLKRQRDNGKKGGRPKKKVELENPNGTQKNPNEIEYEIEIENKEESILKESEKTFTEVWPTFDDFWNEYDKKVGLKSKVQKKWSALRQDDRELVMAHIPNYKLVQPDKQFRKDPTTYLNNKGWLDELIIPNDLSKKLTAEERFKQNMQ